MTQLWPSLTMSNRVFWNFEWKKHGSCTQFNRVRYVQEALDKFRGVDVFGELRNDNILPQDINTRPIEYHTYETFQATLGNKFLPMVEGSNQVQLALFCTNRDLYQITACMDNQGSYYIDCPNRGTCEGQGRQGDDFRYLTYSPRRRRCRQRCVPSNLSVRTPTVDRLVATILFRSAVLCLAGYFGVLTLNESGQRSGQIREHVKDDDCELELFPPASAESTLEPSACVKVINASRTLSESTPSSSTIEAPLTVNFPVFRSSRTPKEISLSTVSSTDALETKGTVGGTMASKRKRKGWSEEEDNELRAAVQRWGEGNWATLAKGDHFSIKRTATQLSQRCTLRKKDGSTNSSATHPVTPVTTNTQYTAEQLATRHYLNSALDMPFQKLTAPGMTDPGRTSTSIKNQVQIHNTTQVSTVRSSVPPQTQVSTVRSSIPPQTPVSTARRFVPTQMQVSTVRSSLPAQRPSQQACGSPAKPKVASENPVSKSNAIPAHELKPAIVHSGAQTVSRSNAMPQLKVAQAKNAVHTVPAGSSLTKTPVSAGLPSDQKVRSNVPAGSSLTKTPVSAGLPSDQKVRSNVPAGSSLTKTPFLLVCLLTKMNMLLCKRRGKKSF